MPFQGGLLSLFAKYLADMLTDLATGTQTVASGTVYLIPLEIPVKCTISHIVVSFDSNATGNLIVGIYANSGGSPAGQALKAQSASTAGVGTYQKQEIALTTPNQLDPGIYHIAVHVNNSTMVMNRPASRAYTGGTYHGHTFTQTYGSLPSTCPAVSDGVALTAKLLVSSIP